ncbi:hypothetical protein C8J56DRAFT_1050088 [Mycena floridula]|nr:hypothetical protein C8J56DRAFT_1050088 [Mycena floridula]
MSDRLDQGPQEISSSAASAPLQTQWSAQDIKDTAGAASPVLLANPTDAWIWKHRHLYLQSLQKGTYQQFIAEMVPVYKKEVSMPEDKDSSMTLSEMHFLYCVVIYSPGSAFPPFQPSWPWPWPSSATRKRISLALDDPEVTSSICSYTLFFMLQVSYRLGFWTQVAIERPFIIGIQGMAFPPQNVQDSRRGGALLDEMQLITHEIQRRPILRVAARRFMNLKSSLEHIRLPSGSYHSILDTFSSLADLHYLRSESSIECICNKIFLSSSLASTKFVFCFIPGTNSSEIASDATDAGHPDMSGPISHPPITSIESSNPVGELEKDELDEDFGFDLTLLTNIDNDVHPLPADPAPATLTETLVDSGGHNLQAKVKFDAEHKDLGFLAGRRSLPHSSTGLVPPLTEHQRSPTKTTRRTPTEVASVTSPEPNVSRPSSSTIPERQGQQWTKAQMDVINHLDPKLRACFAAPSPPPSSPPPIVPALSLGPSISTTAFFNSFKSKTVSETSPSPVPSLPKTKAYFANAARRLAGLSPLPGTPLSQMQAPTDLAQLALQTRQLLSNSASNSARPYRAAASVSATLPASAFPSASASVSASASASASAQSRSPSPVSLIASISSSPNQVSMSPDPPSQPRPLVLQPLSGPLKRPKLNRPPASASSTNSLSVSVLPVLSPAHSAAQISVSPSSHLTLSSKHLELGSAAVSDKLKSALPKQLPADASSANSVSVSVLPAPSLAHSASQISVSPSNPPVLSSNDPELSSSAAAEKLRLASPEHLASASRSSSTSHEFHHETDVETAAEAEDHVRRTGNQTDESEDETDDDEEAEAQLGSQGEMMAKAFDEIDLILNRLGRTLGRSPSSLAKRWAKATIKKVETGQPLEYLRENAQRSNGIPSTCFADTSHAQRAEMWRVYKETRPETYETRVLNWEAANELQTTMMKQERQRDFDNLVNLDASCAGLFYSPGVTGYVEKHGHVSDDDMIGNFKTWAYDHVRDGILERAGVTAMPTETKEKIVQPVTGPGEDENVESRMLTEYVKNGIIARAEKVGFALSSTQFPWKTLQALMLKAGIGMENYPAYADLPDSSVGKGLRRVSILSHQLLLAQLNDLLDPLVFVKHSTQLLENDERPLIRCAPLSSTSLPKCVYVQRGIVNPPPALSESDIKRLIVETKPGKVKKNVWFTSEPRPDVMPEAPAQCQTRSRSVLADNETTGGGSKRKADSPECHRSSETPAARKRVKSTQSVNADARGGRSKRKVDTPDYEESPEMPPAAKRTKAPKAHPPAKPKAITQTKKSTTGRQKSGTRSTKSSVIPDGANVVSNDTLRLPSTSSMQNFDLGHSQRISAEMAPGWSGYCGPSRTTAPGWSQAPPPQTWSDPLPQPPMSPEEQERLFQARRLAAAQEYLASGITDDELRRQLSNLSAEDTLTLFGSSEQSLSGW